MPTEEDVVSALKEIIDPHTNISVYDMGLISDLKVSKTEVSLTFRPTSPWCPLGPQFAMNIKRRLTGLKGTKRAKVKVVGHVQEEAINKSMADTQA
jgi:metal-sulfur cluster biosynthetic enzyme